MAGVAAERYAHLESDRQPYLDRGRDCAKLTIPSLLPIDGATGSTRFITPYQSVGARGTNNLASKLLLTLFPSHTAHFTFAIDEMSLEEMTGQQGMKAQVEKALGAFTRRVMANFEKRAIRTSIFEALKQIIVVGNALIFVPPQGGIRVYRLDKYVCSRDPSGTLLELVIKECIAVSAIPEAIRALLPMEDKPKTLPAANGVSPPAETAKKDVDLYTHLYLENGEYVVYQEIEGIFVPGSVGRYPTDKCPFIPLRFVKVDGESYGRSYIEEYLGDLSSLEDLTRSLVQFAAIASRINPLINPNGLTNAAKYTKAKNGEVLSGRKEDVTFAQIEKYNDFQAAKNLMTEIEQRLGLAFLLNTAIQRPGERVTAEEIRYMAGELENALGGVYSIQSQELQLPLTLVIIANMERAGQLPELPSQITPTIIAGMDALGRSNELDTLDTLVIGALRAYPDAGKWVIWGDYLQRRSNALGYDSTGLIMTQEQYAAQQQQEQMMALAAKLGGPAINQVGGLAQKSMETSPNGQPGQ